MYVCVSVHVSVDADGDQKGSRTSEAEDTDSCDLSEVVAGNQTRVLCKSTQPSSLPIYLSTHVHAEVRTFSL